ncbi:MAG: oligosaccharide flippase family protein [Bacteroidetes bacterium]|nr:oligosaccharide flippase family protein [Bacteroidota bacterium]MBU1798027.1 oligosaccharide flippase family protein [Bacteroidota bacterium]
MQTKILTEFLDIHEFGTLQLILPIISWITILSAVGAPQFYMRFHLSEKENNFQSSLTITIMVSFILMLISSAIIVQYVSFWTFILISLVVILSQYRAMIKAYTRAKELHLLFNLIIILDKVFITVILFLLFLYLSTSIDNYFLSNVVGLLLLLAFGIGIINMKGVFYPKIPSIQQLKNILTYGLPITIVILLGDMHNSVNRYIIGYYLSNSIVSKYVISIMITLMIMQLLYEPMSIYIHQLLINMFQRKEFKKRKLFSNYLNIYTSIAIITITLALRYQESLYKIISNENYIIDKVVFFIFLLAAFTMGIYRLSSVYFYIQKETLKLSMIFLVSILINIFFSLILVESYGLLGIAISLLFSSLILASFTLYYTSKILVLSINFISLLLSILFGIIIFILPDFTILFGINIKFFLLQNIIDFIIIAPFLAIFLKWSIKANQRNANG